MKFGLKLEGVHLSSLLVSLILAIILMPLAGLTKVEPRLGGSAKGEVTNFAIALTSAVINAKFAQVLLTSPQPKRPLIQTDFRKENHLYYSPKNLSPDPQQSHLDLAAHVGTYFVPPGQSTRWHASLEISLPASTETLTKSRVNIGIDPVVLATIATDDLAIKTNVASHTLHAEAALYTNLRSQNTYQNIHRSSRWVMYKSKTGQFHILLPTVPDKQIKTQIVMGIPLKITTELSQFEGVSYLVTYTDYPSSLLTRLASVHKDWQFFLLETVKEKFLETVRGDLITQTYLNPVSNLTEQTAEQAAKQTSVSLEIQFQLGRTQQGISRWIFVKDRLYQLIVLHSPQQKPSSQEFLDSFQSIR